MFRLQFDEFQIVSSSHDDTILIWNFLDANPNQQDTTNQVMGAWPALAHSSHRVPNNMFGLGEGPANGRMRRRAQNDNLRMAPLPPLQAQQQVHAELQQMEVDEPAANNNDDGSGSESNNSDDEEVQLVNG